MHLPGALLSPNASHDDQDDTQPHPCDHPPALRFLLVSHVILLCWQTKQGAARDLCQPFSDKPAQAQGAVELGDSLGHVYVPTRRAGFGVPERFSGGVSDQELGVPLGFRRACRPADAEAVEMAGEGLIVGIGPHLCDDPVAAHSKDPCFSGGWAAFRVCGREGVLDGAVRPACGSLAGPAGPPRVLTT